MAVAHIDFDDQTPHGRLLRRSLQQLEEGRQNMENAVDVLVQMKDGDGSQAAHFTYATSKFGFVTDDNAKAAFDELNSLKFQLSTIKATLDQAFSKFR